MIRAITRASEAWIRQSPRFFSEMKKAIGQNERFMQEEGLKTTKNENAGTVTVSKDDSGIKLYKHQEEAFVNMTKKIAKEGLYPYKGLLVLPTGGGKTLTAARWIAENIMDKGIKVLWIAHRHELLEQAKRTFTKILAYKDVFKTIESFNYRLISGIHDMPVNIKPTDSILFSSKDSLRSDRAYDFLKKNWLNGNEEVFVVIDEAHHATAKTYRKLIERIEQDVPKFRMLGLTATPIRTKESEKGYLGKLFPNGMVYEIDLRKLIKWGILSEPKFEEVETGIDLTKDLDEDQIRKINEGFDIDSIGVDVAKKIADNNERNNLIVNRYVENRERYGKAIVFSVNIDNVIAINKLFQERGVKSDFVISSEVDRTGLHDVSRLSNPEKIARFRKGEIDVLVNVNILTEGTDVPDVQTVFLTRPTSSRILMTQMMGRGLRGERAGGTKDAYIVTFIDNWNDQILWVNPEELYITDLDFNDMDPATKQHITRLIAISKIEEFAVLNDKSIDPEKKALIESIDFIKRIPNGVYQFRYLQQKGGESIEKVCEILVYDNLEKAYKDLIEAIPSLSKSSPMEVGNDESINDDDIVSMSDYCEERFFSNIERYPAYRTEDIDDLLRYYFTTGELPKYYVFSDRDKYDVTAIAQYIIDSDFGSKREDEFLRHKWANEGDNWQTFFNYDFNNFSEEIHHAKRRLLHPEDFELDREKPREVKEMRKYEDMSMVAIRAVDSDYYKWLRDNVFMKYTNDNGQYYSAKSGYTSNNKIDFEIDHIIPLSMGGKTTLDNLQLLTVRENRLKGDRYEETAVKEARPVPKQTKSKKLSVICPDGTVITGDKHYVLAEAIKKAGIDRVRLLQEDKSLRKVLVFKIYSKNRIALDESTSLAWVKIMLDEINLHLQLGWKVDIV